MSKSSTLVPSLTFMVFGAVSALAQVASPAPKVGYIRFWNMMPPTAGAFDLRKAGVAPSEPPLFSNATSYRYSSYTEVAPGKYRLAVHKRGDLNTPLRVVEVDLKADSYFTVLISPLNSGGNVEAIDDTVDAKEVAGTLTVRNCFPGATVSVSAGPKNIVDSLAYGQTTKIPNLGGGRLALTIKTKLQNGTPAESGAEADFGASKHATLLIIPDSYGRFRPRATIDGNNR